VNNPVYKTTAALFAAITLIAISTVVAAHAEAQDEEKPPDIKLPATAVSPDKFVPRGWRIEEETDGVLTGDLNADGRPDRVLRLVQDLPPETADGVPRTRFRALAVLLGKPEGGYAVAAATTKLLLCSTCGGIRSDPAGGGNIQIRIERGVIVIEQQSGSRFSYNHTTRYRFDREANRFLLIGEDFDNDDTATGDRTEESRNYLTGVRLTRKYRYDERRDQQQLVSTKTARIPRQRKFIEDFDYNKL
jgi:hypothetical protein